MSHRSEPGRPGLLTAGVIRRPSGSGCSPTRSHSPRFISSSCGSRGTSGLHIRVGDCRPSSSRFGFSRCAPVRQYVNCYTPCVRRCRPRLSIGFGFYSSPVVYPVYYPATTTVYEPYPVYTPVYQPYPVASSTTGVVTDSTSSDSGVVVGFGPDEQEQTAVVVDQPRAASIVDSQRYQEPPALATRELENGAQVVDVPAPDDSAGSGILPDDEMSRLMKNGVEAFARGDYEPSAQLFLRVAMADPDNVDAALAYATSRFATGDYPMSAVAIRRGVRRAPDVVNAPFDLRDRYGQMAHFDRQLMVVADWVAEHPDDIDALVVLGFVQHFTGQRDEAAETFKRLKTLSETDADLADSFLAADPVEEMTASQE